MSRRLCASLVLAVVAGVVSLASPSAASAQCLECFDKGGGLFECDAVSYGDYTYCMPWQSGCLTSDPCITFASQELPNGEIVRGTALSEEAFAVQLCSGEQLAVVYSKEGAASRKTEAKLIVFGQSE